MNERPPDSPTNQSPASTPGDELSSEDVLRNVFTTAAAARVPACFLRLGAPRDFRHEVIAVNGDDGRYTPSFQALLNKDIPSIEFILAAPNGTAFLNRMDTEGKPLKEIWRVRRSIVRFCEALLVASGIRVRSRLTPLRVAFHHQPLIWNLNCAGSDLVIVRAYFGGATGHDQEVDELVLRGGEATRLAESMLHFYQSVRDDPGTVRIEKPDHLARFHRWPSLFKGNAVWIEDGTAGSEAVKVVSSSSVHACEANWLASGHREARDCQYFRPVDLLRVFNDAEGDADACALRMSVISGVTAEEFLYRLQQAACLPDAPLDKLRAAGEIVLNQAVAALREFQQTAPLMQRDGAAAGCYPWRERLRCALDEAARFVTSDRDLLLACRTILDELAGSLEKSSSRAFRDAHLKNRLISTPTQVNFSDATELTNWLKTIPDDELSLWFRRHTFDIDFETAQFQTTDCDDILHILTSPNTGWTVDDICRDDFALLHQWWPHSELAYHTLLCRSFRELCRRIWYSQVMPRAARSRYFMEPRDHFLSYLERLIQQQVSYRPLADFVRACRTATPHLFTDREEHRSPLRFSLTPGMTPITGDPPPPSKIDTVFLSSHHQDYPHVEHLAAYLQSQGIHTFFCKRSQGDTNFTQEIHRALSRSRHFIAVVSRPEFASLTWPAWERDQFVALKNAPNSQRGNLCTVTVEAIPPGQLPVPLSTLQIFSLDSALQGEILPYLK